MTQRTHQQHVFSTGSRPAGVLSFVRGVQRVALVRIVLVLVVLIITSGGAG